MDMATLVTIAAVAFTIFVFVINWLRSSIAKNEKEIRLMERRMDDHMLHVSEHYATKTEVVKMIGLISSPIQQSVEKVEAQVTKLSDKIDTVLANQGTRRNGDG